MFGYMLAAWIWKMSAGTERSDRMLMYFCTMDMDKSSQALDEGQKQRLFT